MRPVSRMWLNTIAAMVCVLTVFVPLARLAGVRTSDFVSHYAAGEIVRQQPQNLYSLSVQKQYQTAVRGRQFLPWVHPPVEALLFAPLTLMGIDRAFRVWEALSIGGLCWIAFSMRRLLGDLTGAQLGAVFAAGWLPLGCGLAAGQDHIVCLLLYTWVFLLANEGRDVAAGCCLGLTFVRFQLAIPVLLFFVVMRRWRVVGGAVATVAGMAAVSFAVVGRGLVPSYRAAIVYLAAVHDVPSLTRMPSVRGLLAFVVKEPRELVMATAVAWVAVLVAGALTWMRADKRRFDLVFASALLLALAVDYHVFMYDLSVVVLAGVLIVRRWPRFTVWLWVVGVAEAALVPVSQKFGLVALLLLGAGFWAARRALMTEAPAGVCRPGLIPSPDVGPTTGR